MIQPLLSIYPRRLLAPFVQALFLEALFEEGKAYAKVLSSAELMWMLRLKMSDAEGQSEVLLLQRIDEAFKAYFGPSETAEEHEERAKRVGMLVKQEISLHVSRQGKKRLENQLKGIAELASQVKRSLDGKEDPDGQEEVGKG